MRPVSFSWIILQYQDTQKELGLLLSWVARKFGSVSCFLLRHRVKAHLPYS